jgi:glycerophosphoryl diester phosphodiesterase
MRFLKVLLIILFIICSALLVLMIINAANVSFNRIEGDNPWRVADGRPLVIPHRGGKALFPENTAYAFRNFKTEWDVVEIDFALTKDGYLISVHDLDFEYAQNQRRNVIDYSFAEIKQLIEDNDFWYVRQWTNEITNIQTFNSPITYPTAAMVAMDMFPMELGEIFSEFSNKRFILEIKDTPDEHDNDEIFQQAVRTMIDLIEEHNMFNNVIVGSFSDDVISYFNEVEPRIMTGAATGEATNFAVLSALNLDAFASGQSHALILPRDQTIRGGTARTLNILPNFISNRIALPNGDGTFRSNLMQRHLINDAHNRNVAVFFWTIDDPEEMRLLIEIGVDGIITGRPDLLVEIINEIFNN